MYSQPQPLYGSAGAPSPFAGPGFAGGGHIPMDPQLKVPPGFARAGKRKVNMGQIITHALVPPVLFAILYGIMSFSLHYKIQSISYVCALLGIIVVLTFVSMAYSASTKQQMGFNTDPSWPAFGALACLIATIAAIALGDLNFWYHMQPVYDVQNLNAYPSVNPAKERGGQLMDAGRVYFTDGTKLDFGKSMRFRNFDEYCVVPIVHGTSSPESYDFWAVGLNCCDGPAAEFRCGEFNNPKAQSGLRLMRDTQRPFFRLAVQQAEAAFDIKATHPVFFYWMQDPTAELNSYRDDGYKQFLVGTFTYFCFNLLAVMIAVIIFSKSGK